jgi:chromosome segregation ATPase
MNIGQLTDELEGVLSRVQAEVHREIAGARKAAEALRVERAALQTALVQLADQHKQAQANLALIMADVDRFSALVGVGHDITRAKADLEKLRGETERASAALAGLRKQQSEEEHKLHALGNETSRLAGLRSQHETVIGEVRTLLNSFS